ncbi:hypothetical protein H0A36_07375 [Endozoicomonas sp. SM1973]|uniref:Uncharacterized protein n=1 Tax=Spartinivicinus marinus TaxID=2994442 RepID=A0A853I7D9_9GAMM|nr:hypothetical protein [Spartinivicinus marinus]MCX4029261.1 hypothetical protein [Spartinivicinus marinus]NYZ65831.1 hypothetical protein [Spartinivicinus marinus]
MKKTIATMLACVGIAGAHAEWTTILCSGAGSLEALVNEDGSQVTASGQWVTDTNLMGRAIHYFSLSQADHDLLKSQCQAQLANAEPLPVYSQNNLGFFKVNYSNGGYGFEPRHYNSQRMRDINHYFRSL